MPCGDVRTSTGTIPHGAAPKPHTLPLLLLFFLGETQGLLCSVPSLVVPPQHEGTGSYPGMDLVPPSSPAASLPGTPGYLHPALPQLHVSLPGTGRMELSEVSPGKD